MLINSKRKILDFDVVQSEKSAFLNKRSEDSPVLNVLTIKTGLKCTKDFIKKHAKEIFESEIQAIRSIRMKPEKMRFKGKEGVRSGYKKFIIRFKDSKEVEKHY